MNAVTFPIRLILYVLENPLTRGLLILLLIGMVLGAVFPGAIYFYPFWKATVPDVTWQPFLSVQNQLHTEVTYPNRLIPGRSYRMKIEISNTKLYTTPQTVELRVTKSDSHVFFESVNTNPVVITHTFPISDTTTFVDVLPFSLGDIAQPYPFSGFIIELNSIDGKYSSNLDVPIDFFSIPVFSMVAILLPLLALMFKLIFR
jgi:hypothetical protein